MPSLFTLEGPNLGQPIGEVRTTPSGGRLALFVLGGAALIGVAALFAKHGSTLRGGSMLDTIAREAHGPVEFARRAEAWNASEAKPLPAAKLVEAWFKATGGRSSMSRATMKKLIEEAHEQRTEQRERHWTKMSKGLRGEPPNLRVGQRLDYIGQTFVVTKITRGKNPVAYIARPSKDSFGREHLIDARSFPLREFDRQHLKPLDGVRGLKGLRGFQIVYLDRAKPMRSEEFRVQTKEAAEATLRSFKRRGMTAWIETDDGTFVPVKGAMRKPGSLGGLAGLKWKRQSKGVYTAQSPHGEYKIDGNNAGRNRWTVTYPDGDYAMVDALAEAQAEADIDLEGRDRKRGLSDRRATGRGLGAPKDIEAAVRAAQLYFGSDGTVNIRDAQRLYATMQRKIAALAKKRGMDETSVSEQITAEAKKRGAIKPMPGKDI